MTPAPESGLVSYCPEKPLCIPTILARALPTSFVQSAGYISGNAFASLVPARRVLPICCSLFFAVSGILDTNTSTPPPSTPNWCIGLTSHQKRPHRLGHGSHCDGVRVAITGTSRGPTSVPRLPLPHAPLPVFSFALALARPPRLQPDLPWPLPTQKW